MKTRLTWFAAGAASAGAVSAAAWLLLSPDSTIETVRAREEFFNAFAIHGPLDSEWSRVHQMGELDIWGDAEGKALAITDNGQAVQLLTLEEVCCTFDIFQQGEYKVTVKYGNYDERLLSQGIDSNGIVWTYVDMGINGTIDFRFIDGVSDSSQQAIMTQFASDEVPSTQLADHESDSGW